MLNSGYLKLFLVSPGSFRYYTTINSLQSFTYFMLATRWILTCVRKLLMVSGIISVIDIAEKSVEQCKDRYKDLKKTHEERRYRDPLFDPDFIVADCTRVSWYS